MLFRVRRKPLATAPISEIDPPPRALAIWRARPDVQAAFDLEQPHGRRSLTQWYFMDAYREMGLSPDPEFDEATAANRPCLDLPEFSGMSITWLMRQLWVRKEASNRRSGWKRYSARLLSPLSRLLGSGQSLGSRAGQARFLPWYFTHGLARARLTSMLTNDQGRFLRGPAEDYPDVPRILVWIWEQDPRVAARFSSPTDAAFRSWALSEGAETWSILAHPAVAIARAPRAAAGAAVRYPFGVNVIGHARGRSGISEDVRMAALALQAAGIPHVVHDLGAAANIPAEDDGVSHLIRSQLPYGINLFCVTAMDTVTAIASQAHKFRDGRYTIGFWPWELPEWPALWAQAYDFVDEVWASSRFTFEAHRKSATKPVRHMPMAVSTEDTEGWTRGDVGVAESIFIFSFAFDGLSSFSRKNPNACIAAFCQAFPLGTEPVGFILKGLRVEGHPAWQELRQAAERDPRIVVKCESLPRGALLDLHRMTDCFVSLHRAEGFGRNIAECMSLQRPVIVTAYSGNLDFTVPGTAALVPVTPRPIALGEYPFGEGQHWADPDVQAAATLMRRMVSDPDWRASLASSGKDKVHGLYSASVVGGLYRNVLDEIWKRKKNEVRAQ